MKITLSRISLAVGVVALAIAFGFLDRELPAWAANGLLRPARRHVDRPAPPNCEETIFSGAGVALRGWRCQASAPTRGTLVYLHGVGDSRASSAAVIERVTPRGFDVVAYDSRGHGDSEGEICTYGYFEKQDLHRVLDAIEPRGIVLMGTSLGAAVALQEAADDPRVAAVVAAETFSDLRTIARERAPFFLTERTIRRAFALVEERGGFKVDRVSPVAAAARIYAPVLLVHGALDRKTPPNHSERVYAALGGLKRLILVPGAGHDESLRGTVWQEIDTWIDRAVPR